MVNVGGARSALVFLVRCFVAFHFSIFCVAYAQVYYPNQRVGIGDLPLLTAGSKDPSDVLLTSVEIVFHDKAICCGRDSALVDRVQQGDPRSLKDVAEKLQGGYRLSDGRSVVISAEYVPAPSVNSGQLVSDLTEKHAMLMAWNSHLYVIYGVVYDASIDYSSGGRMYTIRKFLLVDPRFSGQRRQVSLDRQTDEWDKVQGVLTLKDVSQ
jgi:hypothetical protein